MMATQARAVLDSLEGACAAFGVTRTAKLTGFDLVGIPVFMAVRPLARTRTAVVGGGVDLHSAMLAALAAAAADYCREFNRCTLRLATRIELDRECGTRTPCVIPLGGPSSEPDRPTLWTVGFDLMTERPAFLPMHMVYSGWPVSSVALAKCVDGEAGAVGLGGTLRAAALSGLYGEVSRWTARVAGSHSEPDLRPARLDLSSVIYEPAAHLVAAFGAAGVSIIAWKFQNCHGFPVVCVREEDSARTFTACCLDESTALTNALIGLACHRAAAEAGAGDNVASVLASLSFPLDASNRSVSFDPGSLSAPSVEDDLSRALARLKPQIQHVVAVDLTHPDVPAPAVCTVVPAFHSAVV